MPNDRIFWVFPISKFYGNRKATPLGKEFSSFWAWWAATGLPPWRQVALEMTGRRSGRIHRLAVVTARHEGRDYLVSMLGECEWVKNVRAHPEAWIVSGRRRKVTLAEVPIDQRAPIIRDYLRRAPGARPHIGLDANASLADCTRAAPHHPVFEIVYDDTPWSRPGGPGVT